jgi:hypothetical protein
LVCLQSHLNSAMCNTFWATFRGLPAKYTRKEPGTKTHYQADRTAETQLEDTANADGTGHCAHVQPSHGFEGLKGRKRHDRYFDYRSSISYTVQSSSKNIDLTTSTVSSTNIIFGSWTILLYKSSRTRQLGGGGGTKFRRSSINSS